MFVLVTGAPASGKSTLAVALADRLGTPLIAKDAIKAVLVEVLGAADVERSRELGRAAVAVLKLVVAGLPAAVVDSVWVDRAAAVEWAASLSVPIIEVYCRCDRRELERRYRERAAGRGPGSFDLDRTADELWADEYLQPLAGPWRMVSVDTEAVVELDRLVAEIRG